MRKPLSTKKRSMPKNTAKDVSVQALLKVSLRSKTRIWLTCHWTTEMTPRTRRP